MKIFIKVLFVIVLSSLPASAQFLTMGVSGPEAAGPPPPVCSNKLDFTDACNSQYIAVIF